ncbi:DUF4174 domain-containing protein [Celeribacter sp.]|uniref:DUF4174 domain-containing protein n=1 Tax=Celeribacter sp. TaxID=1890673 RepID=UPI003A90DA8B
MKKAFISAVCALCLCAPLASMAQETPTPMELSIAPAGEAVLDDFKWVNRVLVVFADNPRDPAFQQQLELLADRPEILAERDVVVLTDADPSAKSAIRTKLRPRGFSLVIVDKDSRVMLRKPDPWDVREISRAIDKTPLRQQEVREAKEAARDEG